MDCTIKSIGLISDTHGLLRKEVLDILQGVDLIIHAGDIGKDGIIESLNKIAPVLAVKGNVDKHQWAEELPLSRRIELDDHRLLIIHNLNDLDYAPQDKDINVVIYGHSHKPSENVKEGVIYINPGSIGPRRFKLPISLALLTFNGKRVIIDFKYIENTNNS